MKLKNNPVMLMARLALFLSLSVFVSAPSASAQIQKWDFSAADEYRYDQDKIEVKDHTASLKRREAYQDEGRVQFDLGTYDKNTWASTDQLTLIPQNLDVYQAPLMPSPLGEDLPGLMAQWHLDEPSGTNLLDGVGKNVAKASDAEVVSGQSGFGYARLFDGIKSHVFIPNYETFRFNGPFTLETWFRPVSTVKGKTQTLISRWQTIGSQKSFALQINSDGKLEFLVSSDGATVVRHAGETVLTPGMWYHAAAVFTGQELRIYLNGVLNNRPQPFGESVYQTSVPIYLGALIDNKMTDFFDGVIDEVGFYSKALSDTQVMTHYGNPQALVAFWKMDERAGILSDSSGYGHNASGVENPEYGAEGKENLAVRLDGKRQYFETAADWGQAPEGDLTLEAWVKPEKLPGKDETATLISSVGGESEFSVSLAGKDGQIRAAASALAPAELTSQSALTPSQWQHVAVTWSRNGTVRIYINGQPDVSGDFGGFLNPGKCALRIGADPKAQNLFQGLLDHVSVYRRVKSPEEIAAAAHLYPRKGLYTSALKDAGTLSPWQSLTWKGVQPYGQEISPETEGLLHLFHLNELEGILAADEKTKTSAQTMGTYAVPGIFSKARWFAQKGYDKILTQEAFPSLSTFTISFWFQFRYAQPGLSDRLFSIGDENPSAFRAGPDGQIYVSSAGSKRLISDAAITDTRWHHFALTSDGRSLFLYLDGQLSGTTPFVRATSADPLVLGNLKSSDTFEGAMDEFALFNHGLDDEKIAQLYTRGTTQVKFLVRSSDQENFYNAEWRGPRGQNSVVRQPAASTVALWHFNEPVYRGQADEVKDDGRFAVHGTSYGHSISTPDGVIGSALFLNGSNDYVEIPDQLELHARDGLTLSAWIRPEEIQKEGARIMDKRYDGGAPVFSSYALELVPGNRLGFRLGYQNGYHLTETDRDGEIAVGRWNHLAASYDGKTIRLYINGKLSKTESFKEDLIYDKGPLYLGRYGSGDAGFFHGAIDEAGIDNHALSENEIYTLFMKADPENYFSAAPAQKLDVAPGRYFQYQAHLMSSRNAAAPEVISVAVQGNAYSGDKPFITNQQSVSFADITDFRQQLGARHQGVVTYQISNDGMNWFYHNGRHWVLAGNVAESNTANQVAQRIRDFPKDAGIGSFYFRVFLQSLTGVEAVELEAVEIEYLPNKLTVISPNGTEAWLVGSEQTIRWNSAGEVTAVRIEYSKDDFKKDFHTIIKETTNTGTYAWTLPDDASPSVKVRVMDAIDPRIYDASDIAFRIAGAFEIVSPNYQERWQVGTRQEISWKALGTMPEVKLEYSTDQFKNEIYPIVDSTKNTGSFLWTVPDHIAKALKVRISDVRDPLTQDASNDSFAVIGSIEVVNPDAHQRWAVGSNQEIRWKTVGTIPAVKIEYQAYHGDDSDTTWKVIEPLYTNRYSYVWEVPDDISSRVAVRISDPNDAAVLAQSKDFAIVGKLDLLTPQAGDAWTVGSKRKIAWKTTGAVPSVNLEYASLDGQTLFELKEGKKIRTEDVEWRLIDKDVPNIGSYLWEVPDALTQTAVIRLSDAKDPFVSVMTPKVFSIVPGFVLRSPNGGEGWMIGSEQSIEWDTKGTMETVTLEYSKDQFAKDVRLIVKDASNVGRFLWTIPDDAGAQVWIRISDPLNSDAQDISDAPFRTHGGFQIKKPMGGEKFEVGSLGNIQWDTLGSIPDVRIEYSRDDFNKDVRTIIESVPNKGQYSWSVPDDISGDCNLRISDARDPQAFAVSEGKFSIIGKFHLTFPLGGENLIVGTRQKITWKGAGSIRFVRIDYSEDDFTKSFITLAEAAPNAGSFEWEVPNRVGQPFKLRMWDPSNPESMFTMDQASRIIGGFTLTAPNGGEELFIGDRTEITWQSFGMVERVKLEFSDDRFTKNIWEITDSYENLSRFQWLIPDVPSGLYQIRISDPKDSQAYDFSNSDFRIRSRINLISPKGGEGWSVGQTKTIRWETSGTVPQVKIEYSTDDFKSSVSIADSIPNTGSFDWKVPNHVSQNVKIRVTDARDPGARAVLESSIRTQGILKLVSPQGGEVWKVGQTYPIIWETEGEIKAVKLEYSRDGFVSEAQTLAPSVENIGSFQWTVPDEISTHVKIRVIDLADTHVQAVNAEPLQIAAAFQMIGPNGGESWHALEKREISWVTMGTVPEVDLRFCQAAKGQQGDCFKGLDERFVIDRGVMNSGRYVWDIPRYIGPYFKIQVCDARFPEICDESDHPFELNSPLEVVYPRGPEVWTVGSDQEIRWQTYGNVARVMVQYAAAPSAEAFLKNEPLPWKKLAEGLDNQNHFLFRVPDDISKFIYFKVSDWDDEVLESVSKEPVMFIATFALQTPNGGEAWAAGTTQKISWDNVGSVSNVRLEFSMDDFKKDISLIESSVPNTGAYAWTLPDVLGKTAKVRVSDASNPKAFDVSDHAFKMMAGFVLLGPDGQEVWKVGSTQKITWKTIGKVSKVDLSYRVKDEWKNIVKNLPNSGTYEWKVPDEVSQQAVVRVSDASDPDAFDLSNTPFQIRPDIVAAYPNGGEHFTVGVPAEIRWVTIGSVGPVAIEYSKDGFQLDVRKIADHIEKDTSYVWTPSDDVTETAQIRVTSLSVPEVSDVTDQPFKILPQINVISPQNADIWSVDSEKIVEWDWRGALDEVTIEYSSNDFASAQGIARNIPNTGRYVWKVPDAIQAQMKIRVADAKHPEARGSSEAFKIVPGFSMVQPNGGELWKVGEKKTIQWKTMGTSSKVQLFYSKVQEDGETEWKPMTKGIRNSGQWDWVIPDDVSSEVKVRIQDAQDAKAFDDSDKTFKILATFAVLTPKLDEILTVGDKFEIKWQTTGRVPSVKLEFTSKKGPEGEPVGFEPLENYWKNSGSYFWTVPDDISEKVRLRISDAAEPEAYRVSESFKIRGKISAKMSESGWNWPVGSLQTLFWDTTGTIPQVDITYNLPGSSIWKSIVRAAANAGSYGWTIPEEVSKDVRIRIADSQNPEVYSELGKTVTLAAKFEFEKPSDEAVFQVGEKQTLRWKTFGHVERIWLEYSLGGEWFNVQGPMKNEGEFEWVVPDAVSSVARLRVRDADNDAAFAISPTFKIQGHLEWVSPAGGELFGVGTSQKLVWRTTGTIPQVKLEYWIPADPVSGQPEQVYGIKDNLINQGQFEWGIPDRIRPDVRLRITDMRESKVRADTQPFAVIADFQLLSPRGGEKWTVGTEQEIAWTARGTVPEVTLEYSRDDFYHDINLIGTKLPNTGVALWKIPDAISDAVKIRISDARNPQAFDLSENAFKIAGSLVLTVPGNGDIWTVGSTQAISWATTGTVPEVRLEYSRDDFQKDIQIIANSTENQNRYEWQVPDIITNTLKLRVANAKDPSIHAVSYPLKVQGRITLKAPLESETVRVLGSRLIQWETVGSIPKIRIEYSRDLFHDDIHVIAANVENKGSWDWQIPDDIGAGVYVRVEDAFNAAVNAVTPQALNIQGSLAFMEEGMPKRMAVGSKQMLQWNTIGTIPHVRLEYAKDEIFSDPVLIADMVLNKGAFTWDVPDDISDKIIFRVSDVRNAEVYGQMHAPVQIVGTLKLAALEGNRLWEVDTEKTITWNTVGSIPSVRLEYLPSSEAGRPEIWKLIAGSLDNKGLYVWKIPDDIAQDAKIRVSDVRDPEVQSVSEQTVSIAGSLKWNQPRGGERWIVGTEHDLSWSSSGTIPSVRLEFSRDGFRKDIQVIQGKVPNTGRYTWTVPDEIADTLQVRIVNEQDERVSAVLGQPFSIIGDFIFIPGDKDWIWSAGSEQKISWQTVGTIPQVKLEYSMPQEDGQELQWKVIQQSMMNEGSYTWTVPDSIGAPIYFRISDTRNASIASISQKPLKITGAFSFVKPGAGAVLKVGEAQKLEWQTMGSVSRVDLEYSTDGFQEEVFAIDRSRANEDQYFWQVPDAIASRVMLRIRDAEDPAVYALSAPFRIRGDLVLSPLAGSKILKVGERRRVEWQTVGTIPSVHLDYSEDGFKTHTQSIAANLKNESYFYWDVPDAIAKQVWLRVRDVVNPDLQSVLSDPVEVQGNLQLLSPSGGEVLKVGNSQDILWKWTGTIPVVRLEYSADGFQKDAHVIQQEIENTGKYAWSIPDFIKKDVTLRVVDVRDDSVQGAVAKPFKIQGALQMLSLGTDDTWTVGDKKVLEWNTVGTIPQIQLSFSRDEFRQDIHVIYESIPNLNSVQWTVPTDLSGTLRFRLADAGDAEVSAYSKGTAAIQGSLDILVPHSGQKFLVGKEAEFRWKTSGEIPKVSLEISSDGFQWDIRPLEKLLENAGSYTWKIPDLISNQLQLRVSDVNRRTVSAISGPFVIQGMIELLSPAGGDTLRVGRDEMIQWKTTGTIPQFRLEYSTDQFVQDIRVIDEAVAYSGKELQSYLWKVPDAVSEQVWIRAADAKNADVYGLTPKPVKIKGSFELLTPRGGEIYTVGDVKQILWKTQGAISKVRLEYSRDGFRSDRQTIVDQWDNKGAFEWTVPDAIGQGIWVRVVNAEDSTVRATHEQGIRIQGRLELVNPTGGEVWPVGTEQTIEWKNTGTFPEVRIEYGVSEAFQSSKQGKSGKDLPQVFVIQDHVPNRGVFRWRIPAQLPPMIKIRVSDAANPLIYSESVSLVKLQGTLKLLSPNQPAQWPVGSTQDILWESSGYMPQVRLEYSRDGFRHEIGVIYPVLTNTGRAQWKIPDVISKNLKIRVADPENPEVSVVSKDPIEVTGQIRLETPLGGERWQVGSDQEISWGTVGSIPQITLEYSKDQFVRHRQAIREDIPNAGHYLWRIPDDISSSVWVRVVDSTNLNVTAEHQHPLSLIGGLYMKRPNGGQIWTVGTEELIEWDSIGSISRVQLEYSTDDFITAIPLSGMILNEGRYTWKIPDAVSAQAKIRVVDAQDPGVSAVSQQGFKIQGGFKFLSPNADDFWIAGVQKSVTWFTQGSVPYVNLEYSSDHFAHAMPIIMGLANTGSYQWAVPDLVSEQIELRISSAEDQNVSVMSQPFRVGGTLELLYPSGGESFRIGDQAEIRWKTLGSIPKVRLEASSDLFRQDIQTIAASADNTGSYTWKIPDWIQSAVHVRVTDVRDSGIADHNKAPFKITGKIEIQSPQGGESWVVGSREKIIWNTSGSIPNVDLEYSPDRFSTVMPIAMGVVNTGSYEWIVPDLAGSDVQIRVSDSSDASVSASTDYGVNVHGALRLLQPAGSENLSVGREQVISWKTIGTIPTVHLDYSEDNFVTSTPIAMGIPNRGSFLWQVPNLNTRNLKIRISNAADSKIHDVLIEPLQVLGQIELMSPRGGEVAIVGSDMMIRWNTIGDIPKVRIEYSTDQFKTSFPAMQSLPNQGEFLWKIPDAISRAVKIRISDISNPAITAETLTPFEIRGALNLISPVGGEYWAVQERYPIAWQTLGAITQVRLEYSQDDFVKDVQMIAPAVLNKGVYHWEIPLTASGNLKIRLSDVNNPNVTDVTASPVHVVGKIELISPNWGEIYHVGERVEIQWKSSPNIRNVKIEYSSNDFDSSEVITQAAPNAGKFSWNIPDRIGDAFKLRVSDAQNATVFAISKAPFVIRGSLKLIYPEGNETWMAGSDQTIRWKSSGSISDVRLEYSTDQFATVQPIAVKIPNTGSYVWRVPEGTAQAIRIRLSAVSDSTMESVSTGSTRILGQLKMISPTGGERWIANEERVIRWQTLGFIPQVTVEYSKDNFEKDVHVIAAGAANVGSQFWTVPNDQSDRVKVRVRGYQDPEVSTESPDRFMIDHYKIRWVIKDARTQEPLAGLSLSDSSGQTASGLNSPVTLERPYGIYTTVWSKTGYEEFKSTWVADNDRTFSVLLRPTPQALEYPRVDFKYDADKDVMRVLSWFERDGKVVPAVMNTEVKIFEGVRQIFTLNSSNPDAKGFFQMVWDTSAFAGNQRYLASSSITLANGRVVTSPISYQLDIPVKKSIQTFRKQPLVFPSAVSPLAQEKDSVQTPAAEETPKTDAMKTTSARASDPAPEKPLYQNVQSRGKSASETRPIGKEVLTVPEKAVLNETVAIQYESRPDADPVLDVYDSNHRLIVRGAPLTVDARPGQFSYLLALTGQGFVPGKNISLTVIERKTGKFTTRPMLIQTSGAALGYDREIGGQTTVLNLLQKLDELTVQLKTLPVQDGRLKDVLRDYDGALSQLSMALTESGLNEAIINKVNDLAGEVARILNARGLDGQFLTDLIPAATDMESVNERMRQIRAAVGMLQRLSYLVSGSAQL